MPRGMNRIVRCAKKGNRCRGWLATASWRGKTGEIPKAEIPEPDNTNGTINVAFRNMRNGSSRRRYIPLFPTGSYNCLPSFHGAMPQGRAALYLTPLFLVFSTEKGRMQRERETEMQSLLDFIHVCY